MKRGFASFKACIFICLMLFVHIVYATEEKPNDVENNNTSLIADSTESKSIEENKPNLNEYTNIGASNYLQMLLGLFFIIAFIFSIAWLIKRMGTLSPGQSNNLKIIAGLSVGQREKVIVLQVMDEQLLVGVTQTSIQLISKLDINIPNQSSPSIGGFQEKLTSALQGFKKNSSGDT